MVSLEQQVLQKGNYIFSFRILPFQSIMKIITIQSATTKGGLIIKGCHTRPRREKPAIAFGRAKTRISHA